MKFSYWQPPAQGIYAAKSHIALADGSSEGMLCGKRVRPSWVCTGDKPARWLCSTCEHRQLHLRRAEVKKALEGDERAKDKDGVPSKYQDVRFEFLQGFQAGKRGRKQEFPFTGPDTEPLYYDRVAAWESGVRAGRASRMQKQ